MESALKWTETFGRCCREGGREGGRKEGRDKMREKRDMCTYTRRREDERGVCWCVCVGGGGGGCPLKSYFTVNEMFWGRTRVSVWKRANLSLCVCICVSESD